MDGVEDMDLLQGIRESEGDVPLPPLDDLPIPSLEKLLESLDKLDLSEEDRQNLKDTLLSRTGQDLMGEFLKPAFQILPAGNPLMTYVLVLAFLLVVTVFVFFGYKLYRSLTEKQRKREEKRKQKQMKKKK